MFKKTESAPLASLPIAVTTTGHTKTECTEGNPACEESLDRPTSEKREVIVGETNGLKQPTHQETSKAFPFETSSRNGERLPESTQQEPQQTGEVAASATTPATTTTIATSKSQDTTRAAPVATTTTSSPTPSTSSSKPANSSPTFPLKRNLIKRENSESADSTETPITESSGGFRGSSFSPRMGSERIASAKPVCCLCQNGTMETSVGPSASTSSVGSSGGKVGGLMGSGLGLAKARCPPTGSGPNSSGVSSSGSCSVTTSTSTTSTTSLLKKTVPSSSNKSSSTSLPKKRPVPHLTKNGGTSTGGIGLASSSSLLRGVGHSGTVGSGSSRVEFPFPQPSEGFVTILGCLMHKECFALAKEKKLLLKIDQITVDSEQSCNSPSFSTKVLKKNIAVLDGLLEAVGFDNNLFTFDQLRRLTGPCPCPTGPSGTIKQASIPVAVFKQTFMEGPGRTREERLGAMELASVISSFENEAMNSPSSDECPELDRSKEEIPVIANSETEALQQNPERIAMILAKPDADGPTIKSEPVPEEICNSSTDNTVPKVSSLDATSISVDTKSEPTLSHSSSEESSRESCADSVGQRASVVEGPTSTEKSHEPELAKPELKSEANIRKFTRESLGYQNENWAAHRAELDKLPECLRFSSPVNVLHYYRQQSLSVCPRFSIKETGVCSPIREGTNRFRTFTVNHGPGEEEWGAVPAAYGATLKHLIGQDFGRAVPNIGVLVRHGIPVMHGVSKAKELVGIGPGTIYWTITTSKTVSTAWNFLERAVSSFRAAFESRPMLSLAMDLANAELAANRKGLATLSNPLLSLLSSHLEKALAKEEHIRKLVRETHFRPTAEPRGSCVEHCEDCGREIFHTYFYCGTCDSYGPEKVFTPTPPMSTTQTSPSSYSSVTLPKRPGLSLVSGGNSAVGSSTALSSYTSGSSFSSSSSVGGGPVNISSSRASTATNSFIRKPLPYTPPGGLGGGSPGSINNSGPSKSGNEVVSTKSNFIATSPPATSTSSSGSNFSTSSNSSFHRVKPVIPSNATATNGIGPNLPSGGSSGSAMVSGSYCNNNSSASMRTHSSSASMGLTKSATSTSCSYKPGMSSAYTKLGLQTGTSLSSIVAKEKKPPARRKPRSPVPSWLRLDSRVVVNDTAQMGTVVKSGHGFYTVQLDGSSKTVLKRRNGLSSPEAPRYNVLFVAAEQIGEMAISNASAIAALRQGSSLRTSSFMSQKVCGNDLQYHSAMSGKIGSAMGSYQSCKEIVSTTRVLRARPAVLCEYCWKRHRSQFSGHLTLCFEKMAYETLEHLVREVSQLVRSRTASVDSLSVKPPTTIEEMIGNVHKMEELGLGIFPVYRNTSFHDYPISNPIALLMEPIVSGAVDSAVGNAVVQLEKHRSVSKPATFLSMIATAGSSAKPVSVSSVSTTSSVSGGSCATLSVTSPSVCSTAIGNIQSSAVSSNASGISATQVGLPSSVASASGNVPSKRPLQSCTSIGSSGSSCDSVKVPRLQDMRSSSMPSTAFAAKLNASDKKTPSLSKSSSMCGSMGNYTGPSPGVRAMNAMAAMQSSSRPTTGSASCAKLSGAGSTYGSSTARPMTKNTATGISSSGSVTQSNSTIYKASGHGTGKPYVPTVVPPTPQQRSKKKKNYASELRNQRLDSSLVTPEKKKLRLSPTCGSPIQRQQQLLDSTPLPVFNSISSSSENISPSGFGTAGVLDGVNGGDLDQCSIPDSPGWNTLFMEDRPEYDLFDLDDHQSVSSLTSAAGSNEDQMALLAGTQRDKLGVDDLLSSTRDHEDDGFSLSEGDIPLVDPLMTITASDPPVTLASTDGIVEWFSEIC